MPTVTPHPNPPPNGMRLTGSVSGVSGSCPTLTFTVNGITITTSSDTRFGPSGCSAVTNGVTVDADLVTQSNGSTLARFVFIPPANEAHVSGAVSGLVGSCPTLTFTVSGTAIATSSDTTFGRGGCSAAANGVTVKVNGIRQSDGSILASRVLLDEGVK
jgi:hypothetical protein